MKKLLSFLLTAILFAVFSISASAYPLPDDPNIALSEYIHVYNIDSGSTVFEKNSDVLTPPASTVKLMTAIIAYEHFDGSFDKVITVSGEAVKDTVGNNIGLEAGEEVTVEQLMYSLVAGCANDAANVLAYEISGSIEEYCKLMNQKAAELGAVDTVFENVSGIDSEGMKTTAKDISLISTYAYKLGSFMKFAEMTRYVMPATNKSYARVVHNRNYLLATNIEPRYYDKRAMGMNSGYTQGGGQCVVTVFEDKGLSYVLTVMGGKKNDDGLNSSFLAVGELLDAIEGRFGYVNVLDPDKIIYELPVTLAKNVDYVLATPEYKSEYFLPLNTDITTEITYAQRFDSDSLAAPVHEGQRAGEVDVIYNGEVIDTVPLVTKNNVSASSLLRLMDYTRNLLKSRQVKITAIVFAVIFAAYLFLSYLAFVNRRRRRR